MGFELIFVSFLLSFVFAESLVIKGVSVTYLSAGPAEANRLVLGLPGKETSAQEFLSVMETTTGSCSTSTFIIVPDLGTSLYNELDPLRRFNLRLNEIFDGLIDAFGPGKEVVVIGFSKGAQGVQKYSLVANNNVTKFVVGCASSYTFLDFSAAWKYGLDQVPPPFNATLMLERARQNQYLIACGSRDTGSSDDSLEAFAQGSGRRERATNLLQSFQSHNISATMVIAKGAGHDASLVIPKSASFVCAS